MTRNCNLYATIRKRGAILPDRDKVVPFIANNVGDNELSGGYYSLGAFVN